MRCICHALYVPRLRGVKRRRKRSCLYQQIEQEKIRWEEQRKTLQVQAQHKAQLAQYEDELARKRMQSEHEAQRQRNAELVGLQEESARRQEALRRQTEEEIQEKIRSEWSIHG